MCALCMWQNLNFQISVQHWHRFDLENHREKRKMRFCHGDKWSWVRLKWERKENDTRILLTVETERMGSRKSFRTQPKVSFLLLTFLFARLNFIWRERNRRKIRTNKQFLNSISSLQFFSVHSRLSSFHFSHSLLFSSFFISSKMWKNIQDEMRSDDFREIEWARTEKKSFYCISFSLKSALRIATNKHNNQHGKYSKI